MSLNPNTINPGSLRIFQSSESSGEILPPYWDASTCLSWWLAPTISVSVHFSDSQRTITTNGFGPGICFRLGQIGAGSQSDNFLSGSSFQFREGTDRPIFRQDHEIANIDSENVSNSVSICSTNPFPSWTNGVCGSTLTRWQSSQMFATTVVCQGLLVSNGPVMGSSYFPGSLVQPSCLPLVEKGLPIWNCATDSSSARLLSVHGCESGGLGCSSGQSLSFWPMVCPLKGSSHQCFRAQSSLVGSEILSPGNSRQSGIAVYRQYDSGCLPEQRRGAHSLILKMSATQHLLDRPIPFLDKWSLWLNSYQMAELTSVCYNSGMSRTVSVKWTSHGIILFPWVLGSAKLSPTGWKKTSYMQLCHWLILH